MTDNNDDDQLTPQMLAAIDQSIAGLRDLIYQAVEETRELSDDKIMHISFIGRTLDGSLDKMEAVKLAAVAIVEISDMKTKLAAMSNRSGTTNE